jgi:hypothetical protein
VKGATNEDFGREIMEVFTMAWGWGTTPRPTPATTTFFGGRQAGMKTALLPGGATSQGIEPAEDRRPDATFNTLLELIGAWKTGS